MFNYHLYAKHLQLTSQARFNLSLLHANSICLLATLPGKASCPCRARPEGCPETWGLQCWWRQSKGNQHDWPALGMPCCFAGCPQRQKFQAYFSFLCLKVQMNANGCVVCLPLYLSFLPDVWCWLSMGNERINESWHGSQDPSWATNQHQNMPGNCWGICSYKFIFKETL
jgi:hypothetical protein